MNAPAASDDDEENVSKSGHKREREVTYSVLCHEALEGTMEGFWFKKNAAKLS